LFPNHLEQVQLYTVSANSALLRTKEDSSFKVRPKKKDWQIIALPPMCNKTCI